MYGVANIEKKNHSICRLSEYHTMENGLKRYCFVMISDYVWTFCRAYRVGVSVKIIGRTMPGIAYHFYGL